MSKDDSLSDVSRLFDDRNPDQQDEEIIGLFEVGMDIELRRIDEANEEPPDARHRTASLQPSENAVPAATVPLRNTGPPVSSSDAFSVSSSQRNDQARTRNARSRPPVPSQPSNPSPLAGSAVLQSTSQPSREKRRRSQMYIYTYYMDVWVPKVKQENVMIEKKMCRFCKTVVQNKSQKLLFHTTNCRLTPLGGKKNSVDQSKNRSLPKLSLDSRTGPQRELIDKVKEGDRARETRDAVLSKRPSQSSFERGSKRLKSTESSSRKTGSKDCETKDCNPLNMSLTKAIVWHNLPLSICDRQNGYDTPFLEFLDKMKPGYTRCCKPNYDKFRNVYLPMYYEEVREKVLSNLNLSLGGNYARATVMFDGWEDVNSNTVVNVMLRVTTTYMTSTTTYFLDSIYTKDKKVDAEKYAEIIEQVLKRFQGNRSSPFLGINGAVSDSARACVKAKSILAAKHLGLVHIQDQAHATDLLLADLGKLSWVEQVLEKVNFIVQATRNNRKLLSRFRELISDYNIEVKKANERIDAARNDFSERDEKELRDVWSLIDSFELDELDKSLSPGDTTQDSAREPQRALDQARSELPPKLRTAVTMKKTVKTRFASCETMLEGYIWSRPVLQALVRDPEFERLYDSSRAGNRKRRDTQFVEVINDKSFYSDVKYVHRMLQVIRRYLRVWDAENCQISEVVPATVMLEYALSRLEETPFFTSSKKKDVLKALERRCKGRTTEEGGKMQIRILQDVHYAAWILDPNLCPVQIIRHLPALERHIMVYLKGAKEELDDQRRVQLAKAMVKKYKEVHIYWISAKNTPENNKIMESFAGFAVRYWEDESPAKAVSEFEDDPVAVDLEYFARNTLALCPSSCATERSFSHQGRIHTKQRNRLLPDVVRRILFCKWNSRVLRNLDRRLFDRCKDTEQLKLGTYVPYEDFFNKPMFSSVFTEGESKDVLNLLLYKEKRIQQEIVDARRQLYSSPDVYKPSNQTLDSYISTVPLAPSMSHSAQASVHDRSTTLGTDVSVSPTLRKLPRQFAEGTREDLIELLSASKELFAQRRRRPRERLEIPPFDLDADAQPGGVASVANQLQEDENEILDAVRHLLRERRAHSQAPRDRQTTILSSFPSVQTASGYLQEPTDAPSSSTPMFGPSRRATQYPVPHPYPAYSSGFSAPRPTHQHVHPLNIPMQSGIAPSEGVAETYAQYGEGQRGLHPNRLPGTRGRGRPGIVYQRTEYPQPVQQPDEAEGEGEDTQKEAYGLE